MNGGQMVDFVFEIAGLCKIKEHSNGRIKLKVGIKDLPKILSLLKRMDEAGVNLDNLPGYLSHKTKAGLTGGSVTIEYDPEVFPSDLWEDLFNASGDAEAKNRVASRLSALLQQTG